MSGTGARGVPVSIPWSPYSSPESSYTRRATWVRRSRGRRCVEPLFTSFVGQWPRSPVWPTAVVIGGTPRPHAGRCARDLGAWAINCAGVTRQRQRVHRCSNTHCSRSSPRGRRRKVEDDGTVVDGHRGASPPASCAAPPAAFDPVLGRRSSPTPVVAGRTERRTDEARSRLGYPSSTSSCGTPVLVPPLGRGGLREALG